MSKTTTPLFLSLSAPRVQQTTPRCKLWSRGRCLTRITSSTLFTVTDFACAQELVFYEEPVPNVVSAYRHRVIIEYRELKRVHMQWARLR